MITTAAARPETCSSGGGGSIPADLERRRAGMIAAAAWRPGPDRRPGGAGAGGAE